MRTDTKYIRESFARACCDPDRFFDEFYFELANRIPSVSQMFAKVDMRQQNSLVHEGVLHLIGFAEGSPESLAELRRLGQKHGPHGLDIQPLAYDEWINSLIDSLWRFDSRFDESLECTWRYVLRGGIEFMIENRSINKVLNNET